MLFFLKKKNILFIGGLFLSGIAFLIGNRTSLSQAPLPKRIIEIDGLQNKSVILSNENIEPINLLEKIKEAAELLKNTAPLKTEQHISENICFKTAKNYRALRKEVAFAILDKKAGVVFEKRCWFSKEDALENSILSSGINKIENLLGLKSEEDEISEELALAVNWWNNHNSDIEVISSNSDDSGRYIILANKFPLLNQYLAYPQDKTGKKYSDIIYVPYSGALHTQELIVKGKEFLNKNVEQAFFELKATSMKSAAYPDRLVVDTISPDFIKNIFLTEQTDTSLLLASGDGGLKLAERVLVRLGTNSDKTFRYTYSSTGALGLGQIMPTTYRNITRIYPKAKLIPDVNIGRVEIVNGIKATILVFDDHFATVLKKLDDSAKTRSILAKKTPAEIEEMKAAIYNGGPGKINSQTAVISSAVAETVGFVAKFKKIRALNLWVDS